MQWLNGLQFLGNCTLPAFFTFICELLVTLDYDPLLFSLLLIIYKSNVQSLHTGLYSKETIQYCQWTLQCIRVSGCCRQVNTKQHHLKWFLCFPSDLINTCCSLIGEASRLQSVPQWRRTDCWVVSHEPLWLPVCLHHQVMRRDNWDHLLMIIVTNVPPLHHWRSVLWLSVSRPPWRCVCAGTHQDGPLQVGVDAAEHQLPHDGGDGGEDQRTTQDAGGRDVVRQWAGLRRDTGDRAANPCRDTESNLYY